jgi:O-antigen/teichoic acid export membrane protein
MIFPLHAINLNILQVKGRSDLFLLLEIIKKTVLTLLIVMSLLWGLGIVGLIGATVINSYISLFINAYYSSREIDYSAKEQLRDLMPVFLITLFMGVIVSVSGLIITENHFIKLIFQICIGLVVYVTVSKLAKVQELWIVYRLISSIFTKLKVLKI